MEYCADVKRWRFKVNIAKSSTFVWTIDNFSCCVLERGHMMRSAPFSMGKNDPQKWELRLYPMGNSENTEGYVSVYLCLTSRNISDTVEASFAFSILNAKRERHNRLDSLPHLFALEKHYGHGLFIKTEDLFDNAEELLPNDTFTIACEVSVVGKAKCVPFTVPASSFRMDMIDLFESHTYSDVKFVVNDITIPAHKAVLAARSRVFATMFEHNWEENQNNRIVISDIEYEVLEEMLRYIYTGISHYLTRIAPELLAAADKYELLELKERCEEAMSKCLTIENAAETFVFADFYSAKQLKTYVINFVNANEEWQSEVKASRGWQLMMESHQEVMIKAFPEPPLKRRLRKHVKRC